MSIGIFWSSETPDKLWFNTDAVDMELVISANLRFRISGNNFFTAALGALERGLGWPITIVPAVIESNTEYDFFLELIMLDQSLVRVPETGHITTRMYR